MEPVTHMLTGAVLARAGLNRRAAYMTFAMVIAAEFPDIDTLWGLGGPLTGFEHHRGITHTFVALPFEAALITLCFYLAHRLRKGPSRREKAPANWPWLYGGTLVALLSHLLLDWTNNYGVRPFFPFNPHWYAGSFVFIFEPVLFAILLLALVMPALFALINAEVGVRKQAFRGRPAAIAALAAVAVLYLFRYTEHARALTLAAANASQNASADASQTATRFFANPHPTDPFTWSLVSETPGAYLLSTVDTRTGLFATASPGDTLYKAPGSLAVLAAKRSELGRIYLDWSMYPVISETPDNTDPRRTLTLVTFADARFMYDTVLGQGREHPALTGSVLLDMQAPEGQRVVETRMGSRLQK